MTLITPSLAEACAFLLLSSKRVAEKIENLGPSFSRSSDLTHPPSFLSEEFALGSEGWVRWMSRGPSGSANIRYLENARATVEIFDGWFRKGDFSAFEEMTDRMHRFSSIGDGVRGGVYSANTTASGASYSTGGIFPGLSRRGFEAMGEASVVKALRERSNPAFEHHSIAHHSIPLVWSAWNRRKIFFPLEIKIDRSGIQAATDPFVERAYRKPPRFHHPASRVELRGSVSGQEYIVEIDLPAGQGGYSLAPIEWSTDVALDSKFVSALTAQELAGVLPSNRLGSTIEHTAPPAAALSLYFETGKRLMEKLRAAFDGPVPDEEFLRNLADYYHVMINAHPYFRVNSSLFMNQVNYLLRMRGFSPVTHGSLDYWANFLGHREFRRLFRAHLAENGV